MDAGTKLEIAYGCATPLTSSCTDTAVAASGVAKPSISTK